MLLCMKQFIVLIESALACPEEATSEDRLEHLKFMVDYDDDGKQV